MACQVPDNLEFFHTQTVNVVPPGEKKPTTCWVGVLKHDRTPDDNNASDDYLWVKCSGKTTIQKIHEQYQSRIPLEEAYVLVFGQRIARGEEVINDLDQYKDRVIALQAVKETEVQSRLTPKLKPQPLQPSNHQTSKLPAGPPVDQKLSPYASPYGTPYTHKPRGPPPKQPFSKTSHRSHAQDENAVPYGSGTPYHVQPPPFPAIIPSRPEFPARPDTAKKPPAVLHAPQTSIPVPVIPENPQVYGRIMGTTPSNVERNIQSESPTSKPDAVEEIKREEGGFGNVEEETPKQRNFQLQSLLAKASPEVLESSVERGVQLLDELKKPMVDKLQHSPDATQWVQQIENLQKQAVKTKTIVGVVGNTGAGKSSVINAMLDEERILGVSCMQACTACPTEVSYNYGGDPYRAEIEFISVADWEKELNILFKDLIDDNGNISRECTNEDTDAGRAYAKIKGVYPKKTKEDIVNSSIEKMLKEVTHLLGRTRKIDETDCLRFYKQLQHYVGSKEKATGKKNADKEQKKEAKQMEFWPLIRVVRVYIKSPALSTGAVIVDLPGVHDSNAARAAVAEGYMKQCTGLWIVAPINRAVDDKAAKSLLGRSFKRQLKMDGSYNSVTFICSKIDDISLVEAESSLNLEDQLAAGWEQMETCKKKQIDLKEELKMVQESKVMYGEAVTEADQQKDIWEALRDEIEDGKTVFAPKPEANSKKRKTASPQKQRKKQRRTVVDDDDAFIDDGDSDEDVREASVEDDAPVEHEDKGEPLTEAQIITKISELRATKKEGRRQSSELEARSKAISTEISEAKEEYDRIYAEMLAKCISGRNKYSEGAIKLDFAAGIRELDQEMAAEEDEENFDPNVEVRDYEEVARSLPVFCVSSRGYQKLKGRFRKDAPVQGLKDVEETGIPQLQAHCRKLTEAGRSASCRRFINNLSQLLNSLALWASGDGTGANLTKEQRAREERFLKAALEKLEDGLEKAVDTACKGLKEEFTENIFEKCETAISNAANEAADTATSWGQKVNRENRAAGGYAWSTYKAICRRNGVYSNAQGPHDWNNALYDPMMKVLAPGWERMFARRSPAVMAMFARNAAALLEQFHQEVDSRARQVGAGIAGLGMLQQQLHVYEAILKDESESVKTKINNTQKDINREFVPVIAAAMAPAYTTCVQECGPGSFMRMKAAMTHHVDRERYSMFQRSADEVRKRLIAMVREIDEVLNNKVDEIYVSTSRDYRSVLGGSDVPHGEMLPKWQRLMRKDVLAVIEGVEKVFDKVLGLEGGDDEVISEDVDTTEEHKPKDNVPATGTAIVKPEPNEESRILPIHDDTDHPIADSVEAAGPSIGTDGIQEDFAPPPDDSDNEREPKHDISPNHARTSSSDLTHPSTPIEAANGRAESVSDGPDDDSTFESSEDEVSASDSLPEHSDSSEDDGEW